MMRLTAPFLAAALVGTPLHASEACTDDAMIVFDGSGSMAEMGFNNIGEPRIFEARRAMRATIPQIAQDRDIGLVVYGPNGPDQCAGVDMRFGPSPNAGQAVIEAVDSLAPEGGTALTAAVRLAAEVLDYETRPGTIVLVTDGKETCGGAPCQLATELLTRGADLTVHVIGFKVRGAHFDWSIEAGSDYPQAETVSRCLADRTGGTYVNAETLDDLIAALRVTLGCNVLY